ncbi:hypothetical protein JAAARDRAFT_34967 [Jaapia argillacea MUCL 33604]|uniref:FHA domain-containing protein n=1 Tax=Jaapia argillacea MUCL 33604 TaxID=933084 RepID=A0A067PTU6_9AGAM|nr:hypothetical protein JAAARDRAFT_34967 [Jaapia argillacea MUCL 33604]
MDDDIQYLGTTMPGFGARVIAPSHPPAQRGASGLRLHVEKCGQEPAHVLTFSKSLTSVVNVGRKPTSFGGRNGIELDNAMFRCPVISRRHAKIAFSDSGHVYIIDLNSHHGTHILKPGETVSKPLTPETPSILVDGDIVTFGKTVGRNEDAVRPVTARVQLLYDTNVDPFATPKSSSSVLHKPFAFYPFASSSTHMDFGPVDVDLDSSPKSTSGRYGVYTPVSSSSSDCSESSSSKSSEQEEPNVNSDAASITSEWCNNQHLPDGSDPFMARSRISALTSLGLPSLWKRFLPPLGPTSARASEEPSFVNDVEEFDQQEIEEVPGPSTPSHNSNNADETSDRPSSPPGAFPWSPFSSPIWDTHYTPAKRYVDIDPYYPVGEGSSDHEHEAQRQQSRHTSIEAVASSGIGGGEEEREHDKHMEEFQVSLTSEEDHVPMSEARAVEDDGQGADALEDMSVEGQSDIQEPDSVPADNEPPLSLPSEPEAQRRPLYPLFEIPSDVQAQLTSLTERMDEHITTTNQTMDRHLQLIAGVTSVSRTASTDMGKLTTLVEDIAHKDVPSLLEQIEKVKADVDMLATTSNQPHEPAVPTPSLDVVEEAKDKMEALVVEIRSLSDMVSHRMSEELEAVKLAREEAHAAIGQQLELLKAQTPVDRPIQSLKRKRSESESETTGDDSNAVVDDVSRVSSQAPRKRARTILAKVVRTTATVGLGAIATWTALAFT